MPRPASSVTAALVTRARTLNRYVLRMEGLLSHGHLTRGDVDKSYAGAFLAYYADLESTLGSVFYGLLRGRLWISAAGVRALIVVRSDAVANRVVRGGKAYADWLPYDLTRRRAKTFFSRGE